MMVCTHSKPHTIVDKPNATDLVVQQGEIKFEHINFAYEADKPLLTDFNLTIKPGKKVGLIGRSGAGKSLSSTCYYVFMKRIKAISLLMVRIFVMSVKRVLRAQSDRLGYARYLIITPFCT